MMLNTKAHAYFALVNALQIFQKSTASIWYSTVITAVRKRLNQPTVEEAPCSPEN